MEENNDILIDLLNEMRIKTIFSKEDKYIKIKLSDLQKFCVKLLELESSVK